MKAERRKKWQATFPLGSDGTFLEGEQNTHRSAGVLLVANEIAPKFFGVV